MPLRQTKISLSRFDISTKKPSYYCWRGLEYADCILLQKGKDPPPQKVYPMVEHPFIAITLRQTKFDISTEKPSYCCWRGLEYADCILLQKGKDSFSFSSKSVSNGGAPLHWHYWGRQKYLLVVLPSYYCWRGLEYADCILLQKGKHPPPQKCIQWWSTPSLPLLRQTKISLSMFYLATTVGEA